MDWLDRVKKEKEELNEKIEKLKSFLNTAPTNPNVKPYGMLLLREQLLAMYRYRTVLEKRIEYEENNK